MTVNLTRSRQPQELKPRIIVFGVGGAGCNAVNNMLRSEIEGVECVVANTDAQALAHCLAERKIQLGGGITQGLGAGARPEIGRAAAEEALEEILEQIQGGHMVFITAGMGGGTGTGAAPVIARAAREQGLLTVGVVTKPFHFEGAHRMRIAEAGIDELQDVVDTLIVIPNQNLFRVANEKTTFADAFHMADQVLHSGVRGITDLMVMPGLINLDFADVRTVMGEMGKAMMGAGEADGENRAIAAAERAISNPLLDDVSMQGAKGLLINIAGGPDLTLFEVDEATNRVRDEVDPECNIIFGSVYDETLKGRIRVSVFATGIDRRAEQRPKSADVKASLMRPQPVRMPLAEAPVPQPAHQPVHQPAPAASAGRPAAAARPARPAERQPERAPERPAAAMAERPAIRPAAAAPSQPAARVRAAETLIVAPQPVAEAAAEAAMDTVPASVVDEQPDMFARPSRVARAAAEEPPAAEPARPALRPTAHPAARAEAPMPSIDDTAPAPAPRLAAARPAESERGSKPSIFNLWRGRRSGEPATKTEPRGRDAEPPARLVSSREEAQTLRTGGTAPARVAQSAETKPAASRPAADDLLEIPAFLRRQAN